MSTSQRRRPTVISSTSKKKLFHPLEIGLRPGWLQTINSPILPSKVEATRKSITNSITPLEVAQTSGRACFTIRCQAQARSLLLNLPTLGYRWCDKLGHLSSSRTPTILSLNRSISRRTSRDLELLRLTRENQKQWKECASTNQMILTKRENKLQKQRTGGSMRTSPLRSASDQGWVSGHYDLVDLVDLFSREELSCVTLSSSNRRRRTSPQTS